MPRKNEVPKFVARRRMREQWRALAQMEKDVREAELRALKERYRQAGLLIALQMIRPF